MRLPSPEISSQCTSKRTTKRQLAPGVEIPHPGAAALHPCAVNDVRPFSRILGQST